MINAIMMIISKIIIQSNALIIRVFTERSHANYKVNMTTHS
jgi:hypothetical protein